jgi:hypothetical protein
MKEQITIRLFEDPAVPASSVDARYEPDAIAGWDIDTGTTIAMSEREGGRVFGIIDKVSDEIHEDDRGRRYRTATVWIQD